MRTAHVLLAVAALAAGTTTVRAQPTDRQIKKDLTSKVTIKIKLVGTGTVQANTDTLNYEYVRGAEIVEKTDYKGINVIVTGDAVYQRVGHGKYTYWKFRVIDNRYEGIPNPKADEITAVLATKPGAQFGEGFASSIVKVIDPPALAADPGWFWHDPMSVSFAMVAKVDTIKNYTEIETQLVTLDVRLYRDAIDSPWKSFLVSPSKRETLATTKHTADEVSKMMRLPQQVAEVAAKDAVAKLPAVTIPDFASAEELARFVHRALREGPRDHAEAVLRAVLAPSHFESGSTVLLASSGKQLVDNALASAFGANATYAEQYCAEPEMDARGSKTHLAIGGVKADLVTSFGAIRAGGKLVDGVETGSRWMLDELVVRVRDDDKTREWIASFADRGKLCPKD